jgi:hypothetical protein
MQPLQDPPLCGAAYTGEIWRGNGKAMLRACGSLQATSRPADTQTDNDRDRQ